MHRSFLKYHRQHLSSPWYRRHQVSGQVPLLELFNQQRLRLYVYIWSLYIHFRTRLPTNYPPNRIIYSPIIPPPFQERRIDPRDSRRASISHGTSPSRGVSNLRSDEPQAAAASSRSGTIKSTAVPWVYGKYGCVGEFRAWRNRGRRQSRFRETREARLLR